MTRRDWEDEKEYTVKEGQKIVPPCLWRHIYLQNNPPTRIVLKNTTKIIGPQVRRAVIVGSQVSEVI
jgi:NADPH-dependent curcumin reductase CurA